ncbi:MAG TPA: hypothetical protein VHF25_06215 [Nitriliruptorales bacterium]|nr:hypothetical protein [Nitriliruptorales bacterium]
MAFAVQVVAAVVAVVGTAALWLILTERAALANLAVAAVGTILTVSSLPGHTDTTLMGLLLLTLLLAGRALVRAWTYRVSGR